jgi:hypothetical protein
MGSGHLCLEIGLAPDGVGVQCRVCSSGTFPINNLSEELLDRVHQATRLHACGEGAGMCSSTLCLPIAIGPFQRAAPGPPWSVPGLGSDYWWARQSNAVPGKSVGPPPSTRAKPASDNDLNLCRDGERAVCDAVVTRALTMIAVMLRSIYSYKRTASLQTQKRARRADTDSHRIILAPNGRPSRG